MKTGAVEKNPYQQKQTEAAQAAAKPAARAKVLSISMQTAVALARQQLLLCAVHLRSSSSLPSDAVNDHLSVLFCLLAAA